MARMRHNSSRIDLISFSRRFSLIGRLPAYAVIGHIHDGEVLTLVASFDRFLCVNVYVSSSDICED